MPRPGQDLLRPPPEQGLRGLVSGVRADFLDSAQDADHVAAGTQPAPVGVIRITPAGDIPKDAIMDVQVSYKDAHPLGHWPQAKVRSAIAGLLILDGLEL